MTAGLHNYTEDDAWVKTAFSNFKRVWTPRELVDVGIRHAPDFPPGQGWHYSNTNYVLLGMILERVTGKRIQVSFAPRIPLGRESAQRRRSLVSLSIAPRIDSAGRVGFALAGTIF